MRTYRSWIPKFLGGVALGGLLLTAAPALAGEIKFAEGPGSLDVDDDGKLTSEGRKAALSELDRIPGEDAWDLNLWAQLDGGRGEGPLYLEFWQKVNGQDSLAYRHEESNYDGRKYVVISLLLEGNVGFNKGRTYKMKLLQVNAKGRDVILATGSIKLVDTGREPEPEEEIGGEGDGGGEDAEGTEEEEYDSAAQDALDSLAGPDDEMQDKSADAVDEAPPPVEPAEKGCAVDVDGGFSGLAVLLLAGIALRRRED